ncbi:MAG: SH3 domain-containing protein [Betaproteobacteria bacterium]|nr:SH3 domain-containing protein [Betaproteobacteria bacterium]
MRKALSLSLLCGLFAASLPSPGEERVVTMGRQRAASLAAEWKVGEVNHPLLGPITFAVQAQAVTTLARGGKILSTAHVSCQKGQGTIAIELSNAPESDPADGLRPMEVPRLVCNSPSPAADGSLVKSAVAAKWEIGVLGDTLARGLSPSALRGCVSIDVLQNVALTPSASRESQRIAMELTPYSRELEAVFAACGETTAPAPSERPPVADARWKPARTAEKGRTNVRQAASADSHLVIQLAPGTKVVVQRASAQWWKVKPRSGPGFSGYVRQDRLAFD